MVKPRDYKHEYASYHGKPAQIKERAQRNAAHKQVEKKLGHKTSADVDHKTPIRKGGGNTGGNLRTKPVSENRGWRAGKKGYD